MEKKFYQSSGNVAAATAAPATQAPPAVDAATLAAMLASDPDLLTKVLQSVQSAKLA